MFEWDYFVGLALKCQYRDMAVKLKTSVLQKSVDVLLSTRGKWELGLSKEKEEDGLKSWIIWSSFCNSDNHIFLWNFFRNLLGTRY